MAELKTGGAQGYLRIATEEAFITTEVLSACRASPGTRSRRYRQHHGRP
jgi:hypothetical protein